MRLGVSTDYVAIGLVVIAILILATAAALSSTRTLTLTTTSPPSTTTITSVITRSTAAYSTYVTTLTSTYTIPTYTFAPPESSTTLPAGCPSGQSRVLNVTVGSSITVCFQVYDFNSTSTFQLNATALLGFEGFSGGPSTGGGPFHVGLGNFTISSVPSLITMGGPDNLNEGTVVSYSITPKPEANGSYFVGLFNRPATILFSDGPAQADSCGEYELVVGNGYPDYAWICSGGCTCGPAGSEYFMIPGLSYPLAGGAVYYRVPGE